MNEPTVDFASTKVIPTTNKPENLVWVVSFVEPDNPDGYSVYMRVDEMGEEARAMLISDIFAGTSGRMYALPGMGKMLFAATIHCWREDRFNELMRDAQKKVMN